MILNKGVYFSANDNVHNWTLAFLRSFRKYNPDLSLYWIPFNEASNRIESVAKEYNFQKFLDPSFGELEKLGQAYELGHSPHGKYWFRRYASFWGPLDCFMYLDARQLVLANLDPVFALLTEKELDFLYYDLAIDQVYQAGSMRERNLERKIGRGFLSGLWASRKGVFTKEEMLGLGYESLAFRDQLNPRNTDQAFINYCVDSKPQLKTAQIAEYLGGYAQQAWAGQRGRVYQKGGHYYWWDYGGLEHKKKVMLLHWAGYRWNDAMPQSAVLNYFARPSLPTRMVRLLNYLKRKIKATYWIRKWLGDV